MANEVPCGEIPCNTPTQLVRCDVIPCNPVQCGEIPCNSEGLAPGAFAYSSDDLSLEQ